ncbi:MAG: AbrB/MazE/SpoVT family DNA-binding domain-containing protein [Firmicutes bacterium]|nr:AbrB/MazE/SpoVT family DNA-binding domain-containing protein [Bacillota bacterium]
MKDKYVGIAKVGEKGQIVIPKEARDMFGIEPGDSIVVLGDIKRGIALLKADVIKDQIDKLMPKK